MPHETTHFTGSQGTKLAARLELPVGPVRAVALFAHCFTCTMRSHAATRITAALARAGIATLRFDFTGLGGSEGDFANAGFIADVADIVAAADHLRDTIGAPTILIGHSLGGAAVLAAARDIAGSLAVVTLGAPFDADHSLDRIEGDLAAIERDGSGEVKIGGRPFTLSANFLKSVRQTEVEPRLASLGRALLVMHVPRDEVVGIENARLIYEAARHPKSFVTLDDADHLLTRVEDANYAAGLIAAWAERYLPSREAVGEVPLGEVETQSANGKFGTLVRTASHHLIADEPGSVSGGEDAGPGPYDLLLAALGTCTSMTLKLYAAREGLALDAVTIRLSHDRNHAKDCDHCDAEAGTRIEAINREITLTGDLSSKDRKQLLAIADKCPVHRTLTGDLHIHTRLVDNETAD